MTRPALALAALLTALLGLGGCHPPAGGPVNLSGTWPATPADDYDAVTASATRSAVLREVYDEVIELHATLKTPAWRAAWAHRRAAVGRMSPEATAQLLDAQHQADAEAYEVELIMTTRDRRENDLQRGAKSVWRVVLVDEHGTEIEPAKIERDRRPPDVIRAEFPEHDDFSTAYVARFPRRVELLHPGPNQVQLRISSIRGGLELTWK